MKMRYEKSCQRPGCDKTFLADTREEKRGNSRFCSRRCCHLNRGIVAKANPKPNNVTCVMCSEPFRVSPSHLASSIAKYGKPIMCCSKDCHNRAQRIEGGIPEIQPHHYGKGNAYRFIAFRTYPKICMKCGYDKNVAAIVVHHKDRNRSNNSLSNLEVLCCNCHAIEHYCLVESTGSAPVASCLQGRRSA